ncbi:MDIS1-interacting receptor like kinase 2 [Camellia lanceoleosa]|uniref:MDIS1-interacting receptor like kinase 2 n=1 Tax=Camellia lanceoleosa TaxID=1840588 RepID=A0ACC0HHS8_9ERIC|nr:MDIS1-interacting receptor like kinase 2 [Camellia lanceoleosa]
MQSAFYCCSSSQSSMNKLSFLFFLFPIFLYFLWTVFRSELANSQKVKVKLDVYSFGVLILEVLMGKQPGDLISSLSSSPPTVYGVLLKDILDTPPISWESFGRRSGPC